MNRVDEMGFEICSWPIGIARFRWLLPLASGMRSMLVIIMLEIEQLLL